MPKRTLRYDLDNASRRRRKSMLVDNPAQVSHNLEEGADEQLDTSTNQDAIKHTRYDKTIRNDEIERLLLHNSTTLNYHLDHSNFPAFNVGLWPQESNEDLLNYPSCAFTVPQPIFLSSNQCEQVDLCFKRPMTAEYHKKRIRMTRTVYQTAWKKHKTIRLAAKDGSYHSSAFDLGERLLLDPDPYFEASYDYYYTGGNLCALPNGNIIHAGGERLQNMMVSTFPAVNACTDIDTLANLASHTTKENCEIFEINPLVTSFDCSRRNTFIARQRNLVTFNFLNDDNKIKTVTQFRTKYTPFISFAQSQRDISSLIITTMKQHVRLYDLNRSVPTLVKLFEISPKNPSISWNTTKPWRENTYLYANEKQFFLIDVRTTPEQWMKEVTSAVDSSARCDHISAILPSEFNNLFYIASNHKLQCLDIRHLKKFSISDTEGAICRWSHQLRYAPLMMDSLRLPQTEFIALSSALPGDLHICQLDRDRNSEEINPDLSLSAHKHTYYSQCLPYQPPTLMEAYENARLSGKCLMPEANLEARLKCCTTGMKFFKSSQNSTQSGVGVLLTMNSNGDIFAQTLTKREQNENEMRCSAGSDEMMAAFERKICERSKPALNYTDIKNMKSLRKVFLCKSLSSIEKYDFDAIGSEDDAPDNNTQNPINNTKMRNKTRTRLGRWQKSLSTLYSYKDALVPDILSIWDIDIEEEKSIRLGNLHLNIKTDPEAKVKDWLETNINPNPPMLTIPPEAIAIYTRNDVSNAVNRSLNLTETQNTTVDFDNVVHSTQIAMDNTLNITNDLDVSTLEIQIQNETKTTVVEQLKTKKKNKKYIKGF